MEREISTASAAEAVSDRHEGPSNSRGDTTRRGPLAAAGRILFAAPMAVFGAQHFFLPGAVQSLIPKWMPWHAFWAYTAGTALIAAAVAISAGRYTRLAGALLAALLLCFVTIVSGTNLVLSHGSRIEWLLALRDLGLSGAAILVAAMAAAPARPDPDANSRWHRAGIVDVGCWLVAAAILLFGLDGLFGPAAWPGIPEVVRALPSWVPAQRPLALATAAAFILGAAAIVFRFHARRAAGILGWWFLALAVLIFAPLGVAEPVQRLLAVNTIAMYGSYGGALFLVAASIP